MRLDSRHLTRKPNKRQARAREVFARTRCRIIILLLVQAVLLVWPVASDHGATPGALLFDDLITQAENARSRFEYSSGLRLLDKAAQSGGSPRLWSEYGKLFLAAEDVSRAREYFDRALAIDSAFSVAVVGRGWVDFMSRETSAAEARIRAHLKRSDLNSKQRCNARILVARILLEANRLSDAGAEAETALADDSSNSEAAHLLGYIRGAQNRPSDARRFARLAVELDPFNASARRMLSQYLNGRRGDEQKPPSDAHKAYEKGRSLRARGKLEEAADQFAQAAGTFPSYYRALLSLGDVWLRKENHPEAARVAAAAIRIDPEGSLGHFQLSCAHVGLQETARVEIGAPDFSRLYEARPARAIGGSGLGQIFNGYSTLGPAQQAVINRAVSPLAPFLPALVQKGARYRFLLYDQHPTEVGGLSTSPNSVTFDGRYYDSLRGFGGKSTVSGIEQLDVARRCGFNNIAHEFAHQVHTTALRQADAKRLKELYSRAKQVGRTLDYYAAVDEFEYFAQGYEAFVSDFKRPAASVTARHTRAELLAADPDLYEFLALLTGEKDDTKMRRDSAPQNVSRGLELLPVSLASLTGKLLACDYRVRFIRSTGNSECTAVRPRVATTPW